MPKLEHKTVDGIDDFLGSRKPAEFVLLDDDTTLFLVKKENAVQFEFDDLTLERMGFNYFTINLFSDERVPFYKKLNKL